MYIWDVAKGVCIKSFKGSGDIFEVAWNKEETMVAACFSSNVVAIMDFDRRQVTRNGEVVRLTPKEYDLLSHLARYAGKLISHADLLTAVWGAAHVADTQYLRVVIGQLRQKLETDPSQPRLILTEPGVGYRLEA